MEKLSADFERFLLHNYPDDWRRITAEGVTADVVTAIMSRHAGHYQIWKDIPEWVKSKYGDRIPTEVLNGNEQVKEFIAKETENNKVEEQQTNDLVNFSVMALAAGYAAETVVALTNNRKIRQELIEQYGTHMPPEVFEKYLETRKNDIAAIESDWEKSQPEKFLFRLIKSIDREQKRADRGTVDAHEAEQKIAALREQLSRVSEKFSSKDVKLKMVNFLRARPQQMALKHLSSENLDLFTSIMRNQGIKIEPTQNQRAAERSIFGMDSLTSSLKKAFTQRTQVEALMRQQAQKTPSFARQKALSTRRRSRDVDLARVNVGKAESSF